MRYIVFCIEKPSIMLYHKIVEAITLQNTLIEEVINYEQG